MRLWKSLYATIWLAFLSCVLIPRWMGRYAGPSGHVFLGLALVFLTLSNARRLVRSAAPARLKRISRVTVALAVVQVVTGLALGATAQLVPELLALASILRGAHVVVGLAILAQSSSLATAFDMWEEGEFTTHRAAPIGPAGS